MKTKKKTPKPVNYRDALRESAPTATVREEPAAKLHEIGAFAAKTHLSAILGQVAKGQSFVITKHGKPIAELKPPGAVAQKPKLGWGKAKGFWMAPDFNAPLEDFNEYLA